MLATFGLCVVSKREHSFLLSSKSFNTAARIFVYNLQRPKGVCDIDRGVVGRGH